MKKANLEAVNSNITMAEHALELDNQRQQALRSKQKRQILDQAYKLVEKRQQTIDEMKKHIHLLNSKPTYLPQTFGINNMPDQFGQRPNPQPGVTHPITQLPVQRTNSLPRLDNPPQVPS